jgi:hypothetical protein
MEKARYGAWGGLQRGLGRALRPAGKSELSGRKSLAACVFVGVALALISADRMFGLGLDGRKVFLGSSSGGDCMRGRRRVPAAWPVVLRRECLERDIAIGLPRTTLAIVVELFLLSYPVGGRAVGIRRVHYLLSLPGSDPAWSTGNSSKGLER